MATTCAGSEHLVLLYEGIQSRIYRGQRIADGTPVILKVLKADTEQKQEYQQEYELIRSLPLAYVIEAYSLETWDKTLVMTLEDIGGLDLKQWLSQYPEGLGLEQFLPLAIEIAKGLGQLHSHEVIHQNLNPRHLIFNPSTLVLKIIDFSQASQRQLEPSRFPLRPETWVKNLPYLAPEQTGRTHQGLDYRTDFYSLGVIFYELLTGRLPFPQTDPLALVYAHLAQVPPPLTQVTAKAIPPELVDIVAKLMAKNPEERYQSAWGLQTDLEECWWRQWQQQASRAQFVLGAQDHPAGFQLSGRLYGREWVMDKIFQTLAVLEQKAEDSSAVVLVSGPSGIGKSALVHSLKSTLPQRGMAFVSGKFDQFQRNIPYAALIAALTQLVHQVLAESETRLQQWRERLQSLLGVNGKVVINVLPEIELIIGPQPPLVALNLAEAQHRFQTVFQQLIQAFCRPDQPLILFLDDLQWADTATLTLIQHLLEPPTVTSLLLILAYRDDPLPSDHPLSLLLSQFARQPLVQERLTLEPLTVNQIEQLITDSLALTPPMVADLAELVVRKTGGNPFFVNQFLTNLHREGLLAFDPQAGQWQWQRQAIEGLDFTENVAELMVRQLQQLPTSVQALLSLAAHLGTHFELALLAQLQARPQAEIAADLRQALVAGFLSQGPATSEHPASYHFSHDRLQQAAYHLQPVADHGEIHYRIGTLLLDYWPAEVLQDNIFVVVNHLNQSPPQRLTQGNGELRYRLAQLNFQAGQQAKLTAAHVLAQDYALTGLKLLGDRAWQDHYALTLALETFLAEVAVLAGQFDEAETRVQIILAHCHQPLDALAAYLIQIQALTLQHQFTQAIQWGQTALARFGRSLPERFDEEDSQQGVATITALMGSQQTNDLVHLPAMVDPQALAIMKIANRLIPACYLAGSPIFYHLCILQVQLSLQYGNAPSSATGYADYGIFLLNHQRQIEQGVQFGQLAYALASLTEDKCIYAVTTLPVGFYLLHHRYPLRDTLPLFRSGHQVALDIGKWEYVGHNGQGFCVNAFWSGQPLRELEKQIGEYCQLLERFNLSMSYNYCRILWETVVYLQGNPDHQELAWESTSVDNDLLRPALATADVTRLFYFYLHRALLFFLLGRLPLAQQDIDRARNYLKGGLATVCEAGFYFYDSLIVLAGLDPKSPDQGQLLPRVAQNQCQLQRWAEQAPMNYQHKWQLVEAEKCRILGQPLEAMEYYDQAIAGAQAQGFLQEEALAYELAARFYEAWGHQRIAQVYLTEADYTYRLWGATAKVEQLAPELAPRRRAMETSLSAWTEGQASNLSLDTMTVMKASQAISREIELDTLLQTLLSILLENAGAQKGCILLPSAQPSEETTPLEIAACSHGEETGCCPNLPIGEIVPLSIIRYVTRTQEAVVLDDACQQDQFRPDPYLQSLPLLSVLCFPMVNQGQLVGLIYLENQASRGVFTANHLEFLQLLAGSVAIAVSHAQLYAQVKRQEGTLRQFLEAVPIGIGILDKDGYPYYTNKKAQTILGQGVVPETECSQIAQVYHNYQAGTQQLYPNEQLPIVRALRGETCHVDDLEIHQGQQCIPLEAWGTPIFDEAGNVQYAMTAFQDITERRQAEQVLADYRNHLEHQVAQRTQELQRLNEELTRLATLDGLTQIANRRRFDEYLDQEWQRHRREQSPLALLLIDIDYFKNYNDCYGHQRGDDCLIQVAQCLTQQIKRPADLVARYGGEEFTVILPNTHQTGAVMVAEAIRASILEQNIPHLASETGYLTLSIGVAQLTPGPDSHPQQLLAQADQALYRAKQQGRNRTVAYDPLSQANPEEA
ncbi:diguanylate cyclase [Synechocystis sp. LKSZ1]|uniref:diguanylate cyclase domain-containing protein n=1 Tax=Synechocystis sp. LKSZ1 TaxID=3144951 RepID=UPI00336BD31E